MWSGLPGTSARRRAGRFHPAIPRDQAQLTQSGPTQDDISERSPNAHSGGAGRFVPELEHAAREGRRGTWHSAQPGRISPEEVTAARHPSTGSAVPRAVTGCHLFGSAEGAAVANHDPPSGSRGCGSGVAEANKWLTALRAPYRLSGAPFISSTVGAVADPEVIICRTNAEAFVQARVALDAGRRVALAGGAADLKALAGAALDLQAAGSKGHGSPGRVPGYGAPYVRRRASPSVGGHSCDRPCSRPLRSAFACFMRPSAPAVIRD
jgi:hypothetical protein